MTQKLPEEIRKNRHSKYPIHPLILSRWSPRSMSKEPLSDEELMSLFEAAHWAPSCYNEQPWRFIYAKQNTSYWDSFFSLLTEYNKKWAINASILVVILSHKVFTHNQKPSVTHSFDTGAAWAYMALEGSTRNLAVHGMGGFDYERAKIVCKVSNDYQVEAMVAIGKRGKKEDLAEELQKKEYPSKRKHLTQVVMEGYLQ